MTVGEALDYAAGGYNDLPRARLRQAAWNLKHVGSAHYNMRDHA